jgi:hypothetical protein
MLHLRLSRLFATSFARSHLQRAFPGPLCAPILTYSPVPNRLELSRRSGVRVAPLMVSTASSTPADEARRAPDVPLPPSSADKAYLFLLFILLVLFLGEMSSVSVRSSRRKEISIYVLLISFQSTLFTQSLNYLNYLRKLC